MAIPVFARVEGDLDAAVVSRLFADAGISSAVVQAMGGRGTILAKMKKYSEAAYSSPWFVLVDLDGDECAARLRETWQKDRSSPITFRVAVREIESWLLADQAGLAEFLGLSAVRIPSMPELLPFPKEELVALASRSRKRIIRDGLVPRPGSGKKTGPLYTQLLKGFIGDTWDVQAAALASPSLFRCLRAIERLRHAWG